MNALSRLSSGSDLPPHVSVAIIGGGQAGLSMSWHLHQADIDHVVLERHSAGHSWRHERWDTFCLVTPNWQCQLPGYPYAGSDPDGFMLRDEIVRYIEGFVASFPVPLHQGVSVRRLSQNGDGYLLQTDHGTMTADQVVVATGGYHDPVRPDWSYAIDPAITQIHSQEYLRPAQLPEGATLVIGSGQSGCQIAEDLHIAGRAVHLCLGDAPRVARRYRGRDVVAWLDSMGYYDMPVDAHPLKEGVRDNTNHYVTGRDGGRDIDLRQRALEGMLLYGRAEGHEAGRLVIRPGLAGLLDSADATSESIKTSIDRFIDKAGVEAPAEARYTPVWTPQTDVLSLDLKAAGITSIVWCIGFRSNFRWVDVPVFDGRGMPGHRRGVSTTPGLYFLGLPWLHTWGSGRFSGVARDAGFLAERIAEHASASVSVDA
ncbi:MSMEG_0569 family flavin-dependent oxidoreductase [Acidisoma cellulosilytica]|uniref:MSMEG_0569 family flavin-dependent oxidoreductase n=1 Tax=Acidisoma cellulosilyticum TaxID=2802395 RepID=A0A963YZH6_9PROT|nr:MSMEG_0569 family flavin-dependent oxidoreductase [Acidisoma cellulosilyticum]MCB8879791.1 MSMEG_0569 family flavin-dependent oxidoreductase [Acidisoma cellulosilyticum]